MKAKNKTRVIDMLNCRRNKNLNIENVVGTVSITNADS